MAPSPKNATATPSGPAELGADRRADRRGNAAADEAVGAEQPDRRVVEVHGAAASAAAAVVLSVELRHQHPRIHAFREGMAVAAVGRGDPVGADADARRRPSPSPPGRYRDAGSPASRPCGRRSAPRVRTSAAAPCPGTGAIIVRVSPSGNGRRLRAVRAGSSRAAALPILEVPREPGGPARRRWGGYDR